MILEVSDIKTASSNKTLPIKAGFLEKKLLLNYWRS